jgi:transmembrane sensor
MTREQRSEAKRQREIAERAAAWQLHEAAGLTASEETALEDWLAASTDHRQAYSDVLWALDATQRHAASPELMAYRQAALPLGAQVRQGRWQVWAAMAASVALIGVGTQAIRQDWLPASLSNWHQDAAAVYRTAVGERSVIDLPDGSIATLDTNSMLQLAYTDHERGIRLLKGQALFEVAKKQPRPFQVYANGQRITALGTLFNVRVDNDRVRVALVEGVVRVRSGTTVANGGIAKEVIMSPGEVVEARAASPLIARPVDAKSAVSWRAGVLVFDDTRLGDAVTEINRYTAQPVLLDDPKIGDLRISGVFKSSDPQRFAQIMSATFALDVEQTRSGTSILKLRSKQKFSS